MEVEERLACEEAALLAAQGKTDELSDLLSLLDTPELAVLKRDVLLLLEAICDARDAREGVVRKVTA